MDREKYIVKLNYSVEDSRNLMESLVEQALLEWQVYNINPDTENYMAEKEIEDAIQYIIKKVITELTEVSRMKLSVGYPMETEKDMIESIKNRAKLSVLNYTIKQNENIKDDKPLKNINAF